MKFATELIYLFGSDNFYNILGVCRSSSSTEIKKAYHKKALKFHPDRAAHDGTATAKFQALSRISQILMDKQKRKEYDTCGITDETFARIATDYDWESYWREVFPPINKEDIVNFENKYQNSEEEREHIKKAYLETDGNLIKMLDIVMCSDVDDIDRFRGIIEKMIEEEELPRLKHFDKDITKKLKNLKKKQEKEAAEIDQSFDNLTNAICARRKQQASQFDAMIDNIATKYTTGKKKLKNKPKRKN